jgi:hypothetical protein
MKRQWSVVSVLISTAVGLGLVASAGADNRGKREEVVRARLVGYSEVPSQSVPGRGSFRAVIDEDAGTITYTLSYADVAITQSHLHLGQHHTNGGISVFLCTNLGNAPAGVTVQACPAAPAEITGVIMAANVTGPAAQGIAAGEFAELLAAIRNGSVYANIHSTGLPAGEIRGQVF